MKKSSTKWVLGAAVVLIICGLVFWALSNGAGANLSASDAMQNGVASSTVPTGTTGLGDVSGFTYNQQKYVCPNQIAFTTLFNKDNSKILLIFSGPKPYSSAILSKTPAVNALRFAGGDKVFEEKLGGYAFTSGANTMRCTRG